MLPQRVVISLHAEPARQAILEHPVLGLGGPDRPIELDEAYPISETTLAVDKSLVQIRFAPPKVNSNGSLSRHLGQVTEASFGLPTQVENDKGRLHQ